MRVAILDLDAIPARKREPKKPLSVRKRHAATWRKICRSLRVDGPQTKRALSKNLKVSPVWVTYYLNWFILHKVVERVGRKYSLTEEGKDFGKPKPRKPRPKKPTMWDKIQEACDEDG